MGWLSDQPDLTVKERPEIGLSGAVYGQLLVGSSAPLAAIGPDTGAAITHCSRRCGEDAPRPRK